MQHAHKIERNGMSSAAKRSRYLYDIKLAFHKYSERRVVWCLMEVRKLGVLPKLELIFEGLSSLKRSYQNWILCFS